MDDEKLVIKAQNGDKEAFTKLIQRYKKEMYCIAKSRLNNEVDIDDAIQETLYKAYVIVPIIAVNANSTNNINNIFFFLFIFISSSLLPYFFIIQYYYKYIIFFIITQYFY